MIKRITILAMSICISLVVASGMTGVAVAHPQNDKMQNQDKMNQPKE